MAQRKVLRIKITDNGDLKVNAREMPGDVKTIMAELEALACLAGGDVNALLVEQHDPSSKHSHVHAGEHVHTHG